MKKSIILLVLALLSACAPAAQPTQPAQLIDIQLPSGYIPNVQFAPMYVAIEKGFFKEAGFNVTMDYSTETDSLALVGADQLKFAIVSGEQVLLSRAQGVPVVYTYAWYSQYPVAIASLKDSGIQTPADLRGKKIGVPILSGASYVGMESLLSAGGLKDADVQIDVVGFNQVETLTTGKEDAVVVYITNEPLQLAKLGYETNLMKVSDSMSLVSNGLITSEKMIKEHPEQVKAMNAALARGVAYTRANPDEAYEICKKYVENLTNADQEVQMNVLKTSIGMYQTEPYGQTSPDAWENMQTVLLQMGLLTEKQDLSKAYSNDFLTQPK
jgi:NitT/TauT family transport system substrate-binding protein